MQRKRGYGEEMGGRWELTDLEAGGCWCSSSLSSAYPTSATKISTSNPFSSERTNEHFIPVVVVSQQLKPRPPRTMYLPRFLLPLLLLPLSLAGEEGEERVKEFLKEDSVQGHTNNWAVLVCSSRYWFNYRVCLPLSPRLSLFSLP